MSIILPTTGFGTEKHITVYLESVNYSEATSLRSISGRWDDKVTSGDDLLSYSRTYIGYEDGAFSIQYLQRFETIYEFDNDTARFIYQTENQLTLTAGEKYRLDIRPKRAASKGIRLGYRHQVNEDAGIGVFVSLLKPFNLLDGDLSGNAEAIGPADYDFNFTSELVYKKDPLYGRDTESLSGNGYAVDLYFSYVISNRWRVKLDLVDIVGKLTINNAPFTSADASSETKSFDENGYVVYDPVVRGLEGNEDYSYRFDRQTHLTFSYLLSEHRRLVLQHHQFKNVAYQEIRLIQSSSQVEIGWQLIPQLQAAGISYTGPNFMFGISADDFDYKKMKYLALYARYSWPF